MSMQSHDEEDDEETRVLQKTIASFFKYPLYSYRIAQRRRQAYVALAQESKDYISDFYLKKLECVDEGIAANGIIAKRIGLEGKRYFAKSDFNDQDISLGESDMDKVITTLRQFVRDWTREGESERDNCYGPVLRQIEKVYGHLSPKEKSQIRCLSPGSGLGRLPLEIAGLGYTSEGNEFSYYMLISAHFVLNSTSSNEEYNLQPWIHSLSLHRSREDMFRTVAFPDVLPSTFLQGKQGDFSMCAGDFVECYSDAEAEATFDVVCTVFFIDTAPDVVRYLKTIKHILKDDGIWINNGPLLWHFEDTTRTDDQYSRGRMELTLDELMHVARQVGFDVELEPQPIKTTYMGNERGMMSHVYEAYFWVARKSQLVIE